ncbi:hypothetical protein PRIPAC_75018 [Pristionchus pacificus]|uniref:Uncharacterized protein n=1 Tax=Pristionchus pacificus TaxID=54126 RepID=A0A2A6CSG5_PRIPA|nr:hypothetical protein PRIPAC_75018 [Pristionchus pacificus]|eukprot:PDM80983.1 hypothetical protein PRIPAC_35986 [Pristionchus pacificus]
MRLTLVLLVLCLIAVNRVDAVKHDEKMKKLANSRFGNKHNDNKYKNENLKDFNKQAVQITAFGVILEQCEEE